MGKYLGLHTLFNYVNVVVEERGTKITNTDDFLGGRNS
jgi:hypothetical protein